MDVASTQLPCGNIDQQYGGVQVVNNGGRDWHVKDYTRTWQLIGTDVETIGCDPKKFSPVGRAIIHSFSIAYFDENPPIGLRGQPLARRAFFLGPPEGLCRELLEDPGIGKAMHMSHYDCQSYWNHDVKVTCAIDSLRLSRLLVSHEKFHGLKLLMKSLLGYELGEYTDLFSRPTISKVTGAQLKTTELIPLNEIKPFTRLFNILIDYASLDSKATLELVVVLAREIARRKAYKLPEYMAYYYGIEPGWLTLLRRLIGPV